MSTLAHENSQTDDQKIDFLWRGNVPDSFVLECKYAYREIAEKIGPSYASSFLHDVTSAVINTTLNQVSVRGVSFAENIKNKKYLEAGQQLGNCLDHSFFPRWRIRQMLDTPLKTGENALLLLTRQKNIELATSLTPLSDIYRRNILGQNVLFYTAAYECPELAEFYIGAGLDPRHSGDRLGRTALMAAARADHDRTLDVLLTDPRTDINQTDMFGYSSLTHALLNNSIRSLEKLLARGPDLDLKDRKGRDLDTLIRKYNPHPDPEMLSLYHQARLNWLMYRESGQDPRGKNLLTTEFGPDCLRSFLTNCHDLPPTLHLEGQRMLVRAGPLPIPTAGSAEDRMFKAYAQGRGIEARCIIENEKPNLNAVNGNGLTLLFQAVVKKDRAMVMFAGHRGADPTIPNVLGETPEAHARKTGDNDMVRILGEISPIRAPAPV